MVGIVNSQRIMGRAVYVVRATFSAICQGRRFIITVGPFSKSLQGLLYNEGALFTAQSAPIFFFPLGCIINPNQKKKVGDGYLALRE